MLISPATQRSHPSPRGTSYPKRFICDRSIALCLLLLTPASLFATSINFSTGFEGLTVDPFFTTTQTNGTLALTSNQVFAGAQSLEINSPTGPGQRDVSLRHFFNEPFQGTASVQFYDFAPGQQTLYESLNLGNSATGLGVSVGTRDYDASCYIAIVDSPTLGSNGPNATCGSFPDVATTSVLRTLGWHLFSVTFGSTAVTISIDGTQVYSYSGSLSFDTVSLSVTGPGFRPTTTAYFDNFSIVGESVPEPSSITISGLGLLGLLGYYRFSTKSATSRFNAPSAAASRAKRARS